MVQKATILLVAPYGFNDRLSNFIEFVTGRVLAKEGYRVIAITRKEANEANHETVEGIEVYRYRLAREGARTLVGIFLSERPEIVHVHNLRNNQIGFLASLGAKITGATLFFTEYGLPHDHYLADDRDNPFESGFRYDNVIASFAKLVTRSLTDPLHLPAHVRNYFFHFPLFAAQTVAFVSTHNIDIAHKLGIKDARYIPHIADTARFAIRDTRVDPTLETRVRELPPGIKTLFVGQFKERKGWETYVRAIPHVPNDVVASFIIVTPSGDRTEFDPLVNKLGSTSRIALFEKIPGSILKRLFENADMLIVPSSYEGFGLAPLEAFEAKIPVIASRVEALTDFLVDGENALLIPPKDPVALARAIERLAHDSDLRTRLIEGGERTLREMRSREAHEKWLNLYKEALS